MSSKSVNMPCTVLNSAVLTAKDTAKEAHTHHLLKGYN